MPTESLWNLKGCLCLKISIKHFQMDKLHSCGGALSPKLIIFERWIRAGDCVDLLLKNAGIGLLYISTIPILSMAPSWKNQRFKEGLLWIIGVFKSALRPWKSQCESRDCEKLEVVFLCFGNWYNHSKWRVPLWQWHISHYISTSQRSTFAYCIRR